MSTSLNVPDVVRPAVVPVQQVGAHRGAWKAAERETPAPLEHAYVDPGLGEATRGHRSAEPAADDDRLVRVLPENHRAEREPTISGPSPAST